MALRNNGLYQTTPKAKERKQGCYGGDGLTIKMDTCSSIPKENLGTRSGSVSSRPYLQLPWAPLNHRLRQ